MLEATVAMALFAVATVGLGGALTASITAVAVNRETAVAVSSARQFVERLQAMTSFGEVFRSFNDTTADDPLGLVPPGPEFLVYGLGSADPANSVATGVLRFPSGTDPAELREDVVDAALGMPRDLNGDGVIDDRPHQHDYRVLPVMVRIQWSGSAGLRTVVYRTLLTRRQS